MKFLLMLMMLSLPAMAQRELWRWVSPDAGEQAKIRVIHAAAADSKGNAALVLGELRFTSEWPYADQGRFRILWLSSKGAVLHDETFDVEGITSAATMLSTNSTPWSIVSISGASCVITDGRKLYTATLKGKSQQVTVTEIANGEEIFPAGIVSTFKGWFQMKIGQKGAFNGGGGEYPFTSPDEISLWAPGPP